jgi:hypothetical protein
MLVSVAINQIAAAIQGMVLSQKENCRQNPTKIATVCVNYSIGLTFVVAHSSGRA